MPSTECSRLTARLTYLQSTLPDASLAKAALTQSQIDQISAFALLSHAACEQFVEERCKQVADEALANFNSSRFFGRVARHLCIFPFINAPKDVPVFRKLDAVVGCSGFGITASRAFQAASVTQISEILRAGHKEYTKAVRNNHGIAAKYQFKIMGSIGLDRTKFEPTFVSRLTQLAELRGDAAHKLEVAATIMPEPSYVSTWTNDLVVGFKKLDGEFSRLGKKAT